MEKQKPIMPCIQDLNQGILDKDTLIKTASLSASRSCIKDIIVTPLKLAESAADSGQCGREAPFGRLREVRWQRHSSLCGACHIASSFLASVPLSASELRGLNRSILK